MKRLVTLAGSAARSHMAKAVWAALSVRVNLKILGVGVLVAGLLSAVTLGLVYEGVSSELRGELAERADRLLLLAEREAQTALAAADTANLEPRLALLMRTMPDAAFIVVDLGDGVSAQVSTPWLGPPPGLDAIQDDDTFVRSRLKAGSPDEADITVGVSTARMRERVRSVMWGVAGWLAACIVMVFALIFALTHVLVRPVRHLVDATVALREGDYTTRARIQSGDEFGELAQAFNDLADQLQARQREVEEKEAARVAVVQRIIQNQESERKVLARNLHDEIGQTLSHLLIEMQGICRQCTNVPQLSDGLRNLIDETRRLAWDFRPSILDDYGLEIALKRYAEERCAPLNIRVDCEWADLESSNGKSRRLPDEVEVTLYRIAQEAVTNTIRHAGARHVSMVLLKDGHEATLIIEDDGCGFDTGNRDNGREQPLGLMGMKERAQLLGGDMIIDSRIGGGTTIRVAIAYDRTPA